MHHQDARAKPQIDMTKLKKTVAVRLFLAPVVMGLLFFWPAGTFRYWQAWVYMATLLPPMMCFVAYYIKKDPELLERRMRTREKERKQKWIIGLGLPAFLAVYLVPGFDRRYGWSAVPPVIVIIADVAILAGYGLFVLVMRENRYASRVIDVETNQVVITSGPYAVIRHPLYLSGLTIFLLSPLALGSFWAVPPALFLILIYVARILNEERVLAGKLPGYRDYLQRVRFRLIPGIW